MDQKLNTLVADYSDTQRRLITHLVDNHKDLTLIGAFDSAADLVQPLQMSPPDLLLLDIEIPNLNGFKLLEKLHPKTQVILITSASSYALKAFDYGVTDYLLKPVRIGRFLKAIKKVVFNYSTKSRLGEEVPSLSVKSDHEIKKIPMADIKWIEALGDYVKIITRYERILALSTLKSIEEELPCNKFLRIHRSYIVNLKRVENFSSTSVEIEGRSLPMSRKRKPILEEILTPAD